MKKLFYISLAVFALSVVSCREQEDMANFNEAPTVAPAVSSGTTTDTNNYTPFDSAGNEGDPTKPPRD